MQGRVAVLKAYGGEFELREYPVPDPEPGAILIRLSRAGVCGSDLHIWRGEMKEIYGPLPRDLTFGHEMCGRVARLGTGVSVDSSGQPLHEGDRVAFVYFFPCGRCPVCLRGEMGSCPRKGRANRVAGTPPYFNNAYGDYYYLRPGAAVFRIPDEISDDIATPANCALAQVLYGLTRAGLRQGDTAVIQGAGGLGLNAVAVARDMGADRVIVLDRVAARLELARAFGADHAPGNVFSYDATALVRGNARLVATSNYSPWALAQALAFVRRNLGRFPFERLVSHVFPLARITEAFQQADWMQRGGDGLRISRAALSMTD